MEQLQGRIVHLAVAAPSSVAAPSGLAADPDDRPEALGAERRELPAPGIALFLAILAGLLAIVFAALKATGAVGWPWLWVLSPLWGLFAAVLLFSLFFAALAVSRIRAAHRRR